MPKLDGTGPMGQGPTTGRGMGPCGGGMAYGRQTSGRGLGWRRFWGHFPALTLSKKEEAEILSKEAETIEGELKNIKSRLAKLKDQE